MKCPKCGKGHMRRMDGKYGPFMGCTNYPDCEAIINIYPGDRHLKMKCPECDWPVVSRLSKKEKRYYRCSNRDCGEFIGFKEGARYEKNAIPCPACGDGVLIEREGTRSKFFGCINYPECTFTISLFHHYDKVTKNTCPKCSYPLVTRYSRQSKKRYYKCSKSDCDYIDFPEKTEKSATPQLMDRHVKSMAERSR